MATHPDELFGHLRAAKELAETADVNIIGGTGEARLCELGILHALLALCLIELRCHKGSEWVEDPANRGPCA